MKKVFIPILVVIFLLSMMSMGIGCKAPETIVETVIETVTETVTETVEVTIEPKYITYVSPAIGISPEWNKAHDAFLEKCREFGYIGNVAGSDKVDANEMLTVIEAAIGEGVDAFITAPLTPDVFKPAYEAANDAGILVIDVAIDSESSLPNVLSYVGTNYENLARMAAEKVIEKTEGKANIIVVYTGPDVVSQEAEIDAFIEATKDYPDIKIIERVFDKSQVELATELTIAALTAYPETDLIWCVEGAAPTGVSTAVKELDLVGKVDILGIDMQFEVVKNIDEGIIWASIEQNFPAWGTIPVEILHDYWEGNEVDRSVDSGAIWWDKDNLEEFFATHPEVEKNW